MYGLNQWMKAGKVPGYTDIKQLFADGIHLNNVGSYVVGCTYFATLYKQNPKGLPSAPYKVEDAKLAGIIQDVVWKIVRRDELAGVADFYESIEWEAVADIASVYFAAAVKDNGGGLVIGSELEGSKVAKANRHLAEAGLAQFADIRPGDAMHTLRWSL
jgi:hypothetical protein